MVDVGEQNKIGLLRLVERTDEPSNNHPYARIWLVECLEMNHKGSVNSCDFHSRRCPECEPDSAKPWNVAATCHDQVDQRCPLTKVMPACGQQPEMRTLGVEDGVQPSF